MAAMKQFQVTRTRTDVVIIQCDSAKEALFLAKLGDREWGDEEQSFEAEEI